METSRSAERYSRLRYRTLSGRPGAVLAHPSGEVSLLARQSIDLLASLRGFKTIAEHVQTYLDSLASVNPGLGRRVGLEQDVLCAALHEMTDNSLLMPEAEWLRRVLSCEAGDAADRITVCRAAIVTKGRPSYLRRALDHLVRELGQSGRSCPIGVYDDSLDHCSRVAAAEVASGCATPIHFVGVTEKVRILQRIEAAGSVPPEVLRFALQPVGPAGPAYGANLNWVLLDTIGERFLCIDDDIVVTPYAPASADAASRNRLVVTSAAESANVTVFASRDEAIGAVGGAEHRLLSLHEEIMGHSLRSCLRRWRLMGLDVTDISGNFATEILTLERATVAGTMLGIVGDSGSSQPWIGVTGYSREKLKRAVRSNQALLQSHEVIRSVSEPTISDQPHFMNGACGLDHSQMLPPFLPVCRNMDGVFAMVLRKCCPGRYFAYLPWVVAHDPPSRQWQAHSHDHARISELLSAAIGSLTLEPHVSDTGANLRMLGRHLIHIGSLPSRDLEALLRAYSCTIALMRVRSAEEALQDCSADDSSWRKYCRDYRDRFTRILADCSDVSASDLRGFGTDALLLTGELFTQFGQLLVHWPDILAVTRRLHEQYGSFEQLAAAE